MSSLSALPAEVQKSILTSLDYASLCQLRSTNRYFYNFLTETEIHDLFLSIDIQQGDFSDRPKDGQKCSNCAGHCDATAAQVKTTNRKLKLAEKEVQLADTKVEAAITGVTAAITALNNARAAVRTTKAKEEKKKKREKVAEAQEQLKAAQEVLKIAQTAVVQAQRNKAAVTTESQDDARSCSTCKRKYNGYMAPGLLILNLTLGNYWTLDKACFRTSHFNRRLGYAGSMEAMQKDGKICKICWKSTSRGTAGIQRRKVFVEEYGYWLRETWLMEGKAIETKARMLANKSFEEIEKKEEEANAAKALKELTDSKAEVENDEN